MTVKIKFSTIILILLAVMFVACGDSNYTVTYDGNTNTGGAPPEDTNHYASAATVTVMDQGTLVKDGYTFTSWNTLANGTGTDLSPSSTFTMGAADRTLYAKWTLATCGDGTVQAGEECDDGNLVNNDACTNNCTLPICGDGIVQGDEECDDGNTINTDTCISSCLSATCGDGYVQPGEACDDGNSIDGDACTNNCALPTCGDGVIQPGEECDDGSIGGGGCTINCLLSSECGNGSVETGEECDDGNTADGDGCNSTCQSE